MSEVIVREFMLEHPVTVKSDTPLVEAVETLLGKELAGLAVINGSGEVTGFISDYDCHKAMLMSSYHCDNPVYVSDIQHQNYVAINPEDGIADIAIKLVNEPASLYLVIENKKLIGTLTRHDILKALDNNLRAC